MRNIGIKMLALVSLGLLVALSTSLGMMTANAASLDPAYEYITIEAENMTENLGEWAVKDDPAASGGKYIVTAAAKAGSPNPKQCVKYVFNVKTAGEYSVFIRFLTLTEGETSVHFKVNGAGNRTEHGNNDAWFWNFLNNDNPDTPQKFKLNAGQNVLEIFHREPDVRMDKLLITNNPNLKAKDI